MRRDDTSAVLCEMCMDRVLHFDCMTPVQSRIFNMNERTFLCRSCEEVILESSEREVTRDHFFLHFQDRYLRLEGHQPSIYPIQITENHGPTIANIHQLSPYEMIEVCTLRVYFNISLPPIAYSYSPDQVIDLLHALRLQQRERNRNLNTA